MAVCCIRCCITSLPQKNWDSSIRRPHHTKPTQEKGLLQHTMFLKMGKITFQDRIETYHQAKSQE